MTNQADRHPQFDRRGELPVSPLPAWAGAPYLIGASALSVLAGIVLFAYEPVSYAVGRSHREFDTVSLLVPCVSLITLVAAALGAATGITITLIKRRPWHVIPAVLLVAAIAAPPLVDREPSSQVDFRTNRAARDAVVQLAKSNQLEPKPGDP